MTAIRRAAAAPRRHPQTRADREEIARPEFPARSQPDRPDRARGGAACRRHRGRDRSGTRRPDPRAAVGGCSAGDRGRARRARDRGAGGDRRALSRTAHGDRGRCARFRYRGSAAPKGRCGSSPTCPTISRPSCSSAGSRPSPGRRCYDRLVLMFQREVAERLVASPDSKAYGRLSVLTQWRTMPKILFDIAPSAFVPPPKVTSSVVELVPRPQPAALRPRHAGARHGSRFRPAPQDAAAEPEDAPARSDPGAGSGRHRADRARRTYSGRRLRAARQRGRGRTRRNS